MSSILGKLLKAELKHFISPFMKGYLIKNLSIFLLFLIIFVPVVKSMDIPIREHDPSREKYAYDQYPNVDDIDYNYYDSYVSVDFDEEGPQRTIKTDGEAEGPLTVGSGFLVIFTLVVLLINLIIVHLSIYTRTMKNGYGRAVTRSGVETGDLLKTKMIGVSVIFAALSFVDILIASIVAEILNGWFWNLFIVGVSSMVVVVVLYSISFGILTSIKIPKKERMVIPLGVFFVISTGLLVITQYGSNILISIFDDMTGIGTTSGAGTPLMYLSPFHLLGEISDWAIYGTDISLWSFLWIPFAMALVYIGYRSMSKVKYHHLRSIDIQPIGLNEENWHHHP